MVSLEQLWLPIVVAAVLVFVASSLIHMAFKWHNSDYRPLANEDAVREAVRAGNPAPGQYVIPYCADPKAMRSPEMQKKYADGPLGFLTLRPNGAVAMGPMLGMWFVLNLFVALIAGYLASRTLAPEALNGLRIARVVSSVTFMSYAVGSLSAGIWMAKPWASVAKELLDAAIYACVTAAAFAWLWPR